MLSKQLLADIRDKAQGKIRESMFKDAGEAGKEIAAFGELMKQKYGAIISAAPPKGRDRAEQKVASDYGGDWHQLKDVSRMTIIVPTMDVCRKVLAEMQNYFRASNGGGIMQVKDVTGLMDPCGYSSTTVFVRTKVGRAAEIQVNIPQIIYAKQGELSFIKTCGPSAFLKIKTAYQLEGGLGHGLYEIYRVAPLSPAGQQAASLSRAYYEYFRHPPGPPAVREGLKASLAAIKATHAHIFAHH